MVGSSGKGNLDSLKCFVSTWRNRVQLGAAGSGLCKSEPLQGHSSTSLGQGAFVAQGSRTCPQLCHCALGPVAEMVPSPVLGVRHWPCHQLTCSSALRTLAAEPALPLAAASPPLPRLPPHGRVSDGEGRKAARAQADMDL